MSFYLFSENHKQKMGNKQAAAKVAPVTKEVTVEYEFHQWEFLPVELRSLIISFLDAQVRYFYPIVVSLLNNLIVKRI